MKYLESAYDEFCKYEKTFWEYSEKAKQGTNSMIKSTNSVIHDLLHKIDNTCSKGIL